MSDFEAARREAAARFAAAIGQEEAEEAEASRPGLAASCYRGALLGSRLAAAHAVYRILRDAVRAGGFTGLVVLPHCADCGYNAMVTLLAKEIPAVAFVTAAGSALYIAVPDDVEPLGVLGALHQLPRDAGTCPGLYPVGGPDGRHLVYCRVVNGLSQDGTAAAVAATLTAMDGHALAVLGG